MHLDLLAFRILLSPMVYRHVQETDSCAQPKRRQQTIEHWFRQSETGRRDKKDMHLWNRGARYDVLCCNIFIVETLSMVLVVVVSIRQPPIVQNQRLGQVSPPSNTECVVVYVPLF
jgi:hypothetical protein